MQDSNTFTMVNPMQESTLKVPKREIFETELFILSDPIWVGDLRTEPIKPFVYSVKLIFAILFLHR